MGTKAQEVYLINKLKKGRLASVSILLPDLMGCGWGRVKDRGWFRIRVKEVKLVKGLA